MRTLSRAIQQRDQNPDVNSYIPDADPAEGEGSKGESDKGTGDAESIPLPPDVGRKAPVEDPPGHDGPPVGDVDDSPKRIV